MSIIRTRAEKGTVPSVPSTVDGRTTILLGADEHRVNDEAVASLAVESDLYQRGGILVEVVKASVTKTTAVAVRRPVGSTVVRAVPPPLLRDRLTRCARWAMQSRGRNGRLQERPAHPPAWSVNAVYARGRWPDVRTLEAVVDHPVILGDGSILTADGYDSESKLLVSIPSNLRLTIPDNPTRHDVYSAVEALNDALTDFPFERPEHRGAWFAGLLTPLAWFAFDGPAPMTLIDGNVRGVGKGLLGDVISLTLTGRRFPVMTYTSDKEELRKRITSLAMEGERMVLLDNLAGAVGNDVLDMALTADRWKDRVLGTNRVYDGPLHVAWFATGNNVQLRADTARRCSHCRIETFDERPELKDGFKYADLRGHVRKKRGALLSAALTVLRGWYTAGRPRHGLKAWGSYEGWSSVVREAVVFAGLSDPGEARHALQTAADRDALTMSALIDAVARMDPARRGVTTAEIVDAIRKPSVPAPDWLPDLKSAVEELCGRIDGRALGYDIRKFVKRNFGGRMIDRAGTSHGSNRWAVYPAPSSTGAAACPPSPPSPPTDLSRPGCDGGDGGDDPTQRESASAQQPADAERKVLRQRFRNNDRPTNGGAT